MWSLARQLPELRIQVDDREFLPRTSPVLAADAEIRQRFGTYERFIVALESDRSGVETERFRDDYLRFVEDLSSNHNLAMLLMDRLYRSRPHGSALATGDLLPLEPPNGAWVAAARRHSQQIRRLASGNSGRSAFVEVTALSGGGVRTLGKHIDPATAALEERRPGEYRVRLLGRQIVLNALGDAILADLERILPWSLLVVLASLWLVFRSFPVALLGLLEVGLAIACTLAMLRLLGQDLSLMTALVPVLITALGIADEIHLFGEFLLLRTASPETDRRRLAWRAAGRVFFPVTATSLTTIIGFSSFLFTDVPALEIFGLLASLGIFFSWFFTLGVVPFFLGRLPPFSGPRWLLRPPPLPAFGSGAIVLLSIILLPGILRLRIDDGWTRNFSPDHPIVQDVAWYQGESTGLYRLDVLLERRDGRPWSEPEPLARLAELGSRAEALAEIGTAFSLADLVRDRAWELNPNRPRPATPEDRARIDFLLLTYRLFNEEALLRAFLDAPGTTTRLMLSVRDDRYGTARQAAHGVARLLREDFGETVTVGIGGSAERGRVLIASVVRTQGASVLASAAIAFLVLGFSSRQWRRSAKCLAIVTWSLALVLGVAGWAGLALGVASSCFLALGLGVGLDYVIHLAFGRGDRAIISLRVAVNVAIVGAAMAVLTLSANPTVAKLGALIVLSMVSSGLAAFLVLGRAGPQPLSSRRIS